jgi:fido (protein-threonine AMPylation protein)
MTHLVLSQRIESSAAVIFRELRDEACLRGLDRGMFVGRLAYYLGEVNTLHPFREGNGRAQRTFFGQLARDAGFTLAWQHLDPVRNVEASAAIMRGDPEPMRKMLDALVRTAPDHTRSALPASPGDRKRSLPGFHGYCHRGLGMAESAPCP